VNPVTYDILTQRIKQWETCLPCPQFFPAYARP